MMKNKLGQQEMVGFVLIVVLVMVGLMVFLVISARDSGEVGTGTLASNMLDVIMKTTSDCAVVYEPDYDSYEDLFKSCYKGSRCSNLNVSACDYLNESFAGLVDIMMDSEADVSAYDIEFFVKDGEGILMWEGGNCSGGLSGAQRSVVSGGDSLVIRMNICSVV